MKQDKDNPLPEKDEKITEEEKCLVAGKDEVEEHSGLHVRSSVCGKV